MCVTTKDGGTLHTIGEACNYMPSMGKKRELRLAEALWREAIARWPDATIILR